MWCSTPSTHAQGEPAAAKLLVAHESALLAAGVLSALAPLISGVAVLPGELMQRVAQDRPVLVVTDHAQALRLLTEPGRVAPPLLVVDDRMAASRVRLALDAGVSGIVDACCALPVLLGAVQALLRGQRYLCESASAALAQVAALTPLTMRERQVLELLGQGRNNKAIALRLDLAEGTVKTHVKSILGKLCVSSRTQAAAVARQLGLIVDGPPLWNRAGAAPQYEPPLRLSPARRTSWRASGR